MIDMNVGAATRAGSISQALAGNQKLGQEEFLKLLITQLTNQDPLSPQDDKEFLAQMAQFSTVEGVGEMSKAMYQLQGASLIGRTVDATVASASGTDQITGVVKAVYFKGNEVHFTVNDRDVTLSQISQVRA
jgi:flagellar basal-body rod modification protein FlgD